MPQDNLIEQPTITGPDESARPASTDQPGIAAPTAIAVAAGPAEPDGDDETSHDDPSPIAGRPCADRCSAVDSADIDDAERSADAGVAHRVLVIGVAAILFVVALVGRRRRGRTGVSP